MAAIVVQIRTIGPIRTICPKWFDFSGPDFSIDDTQNFYGLSLTGAKIFAFKICLENHTNFEGKKFSFYPLKSTSLDT